MSTPIRIKRSAVAGKRPTTAQLQFGELALNFYDGHLYAKRDTGGVGIGTTTALLTPWKENFGAASIYYDNSVGIVTTLPSATLDVDGTLNIVGISTFKDKVIFDSTNSIQIPVGVTTQRDPSPVAGQIRYNSELSSFEGYGPGNAWGSLGGVKDVDGDTYIKPETSPGSDEDTLYFYNAGSNTATISSTTTTLNTDLSVAGIATFNTDVEFVSASAGITSAYWDSSANLLNFKDNVKATFGDGNGLQIYHSGSISRIVDTSGTLVYRSASHRIKNQGGTEDLAVFTEDAAVELYYGMGASPAEKKFETTGYGVTISGGLNVSGISTLQGDVRVGIDTSQGVILTSPNGTQYRLIVSDAGVLSTTAV